MLRCCDHFYWQGSNCCVRLWGLLYLYPVKAVKFMCANTLGDLQILRICCFYYLRQKCSVGGRIVSAHNDFFPYRQLHPANLSSPPLLLIPPKYLMTQIQAKEMQPQQSLSLKIKLCIVPVLLCWGMKPVGWAVWVWHRLLQHEQARSCGASELVGLPVSCRAQFHPGTKSSQGRGQENLLLENCHCWCIYTLTVGASERLS